MAFGAIAGAVLPGLIGGIGSLIGGRQANRASAQEAQKNRNFQERMRNTQWQSAVADMQAAGINPALAYSQGPNAAPGGSQAQQMDAISPAISSAMQASRFRADIEQVKAETQRVKTETMTAKEIQARETAKNAILGVQRMASGSVNLTTGQEGGLLARQLQAEVDRIRAQARREGYLGDTLKPLADLSGTMGQWLPALGLASQMNPGGLMRSSSKWLRSLKQPVGRARGRRNFRMNR